MGYYGWRNQQADGEHIYQEYMQKLTQFVIWVLDQGYQVRLLMGEIPADQRPVDDVMAAVVSHPATRKGAITAPLINTLEDVFHAIAETDMVVATRFHNVLYALMLGRPVVSIGYAAKNEALLKEMGQVGYCQHIESFDVDRLKEQFCALTANHADALQKIAETNRRYRNLLDQQYDLLIFGRSAISEGNRPGES
jgi:polysaccharide pyruvyl transferase WcaK-like protein